MRLVDQASCWALALWAAIACGCFGDFDVECGQDAHCDRFPGGLCHTNSATERRWCSYPAPACPSGHRYSDLDVGDGVSGACTGEPPVRCDPMADFGEPTLVPSLSSSLDEVDMAMTSDERIVFLGRNAANTYNLLMSERVSTLDYFTDLSESPKLAVIEASLGKEAQPYPTGDGLLLYFSRSTGFDDSGEYVASRTTRSDAFDSGTRVLVDGSPIEPFSVFGLVADGQIICWTDSQGIPKSATRSHSVFEFSGVQSLASFRLINGAITADGLTVYHGYQDVLVSARLSRSDLFETSATVANVNSVEGDFPLFVSSDGCVLYIGSHRPGGLGGSDIWVARRPR